MHCILVFALLWPAVSQAFSLDTPGKHWKYTTQQLANTTSADCKKAYSAEIACDDYLLQLVDAGEEASVLDSMTPENFTKACTSACQTSLNNYILNVKQTCKNPGDQAVRSLGFLGLEGHENASVSTIGSIFQYRLMRSCAKDEKGKFCYIQQNPPKDVRRPSFEKAIPSPDFACGAGCGLAYYWHASAYPWSLWSVGDPSVMDIDNKTGHRVNGANSMLFFNPGKNESIQQGWKHVQDCGYGNATTAPFDTGIKNVTVTLVATPHPTSGGTSATSGATSGATSRATSGATSEATSGASGTVVATGSLALVVLSIFAMA